MDWKEIVLGDYIDILTDYHANGAYEKLKANITLKHEKDFAVMIRTLNFERADFEENLIYINEKEYNFLSKSKVYPYDVLMNKIADPGSVYLMPDLKRPVSLAMNLFLIRFNSTVNQKFMYYMMHFYEPYIKLYANGAATLTITKDAVRKLKFKLPNRPEQDKISGILSAYDALIENNLERIKLLEEMAQITYEEWFVRMKFPGHEEVEVDSETGLPIGWIKASCYDYMDVLSGGTPKTNIEEYWNGDIKFFTPKDAQPGFFTGNTEKTITSIGLKKCNSKLYDIGTIFITARGTVGKLNLAHEPMAMNQSCYALRGKEGVPQYFLFCALSKAIDAFKGAANGGVFDAIVVDTFKFLSFVRPEISLVKKFDQMVSPMFDSIYNLLEQNKRLQEARDILLPRLMTGIIDIEQVALPEALLERINNENDNN
ncbi:restriction endonuclease subunit S [Shewanella colwelliana]|uniref:restriction endonuclease subunit S n=1 Tax=Shewanella colwelliana TaxID=23 RepID=UPI0022B00516|nr:restriction endonuclease subunit S [Shewanella colwelliana]MCZ4337880.1 restriction endonuclease subunit S [Shewanella colwelliana]